VYRFQESPGVLLGSYTVTKKRFVVSLCVFVPLQLEGDSVSRVCPVDFLCRMERLLVPRWSTSVAKAKERLLVQKLENLAQYQR
jgi:hypothetical protein